jgi:hypothetical protein
MIVEYCTLSDVKLALDLRGNNTSNDTWIQSLIPQARSEVDQYVGYNFQSTSGTRLFSGDGDGLLLTGPIVSFSQVRLSVTGTYFTTAPADITTDCYLWPDTASPSYGIGRDTDDFEEGRRNVEVTGVFGFQTVPLSISRATTRLVAHWFKMRDTNYADTMSEQGSIRQKYQKDMPPDVVQILDLWRHRRFLST